LEQVRFGSKTVKRLKIRREHELLLQFLEHPLQAGFVFYSPGYHVCYRVIGPCCRLFDREQLPWPCCRLSWRGKEPSWRRVGRRFVLDIGTKNFPSYCVEILELSAAASPLVKTLYWVTLPQHVRDWWYTGHLQATSEQVGRAPGSSYSHVE